MALQHLLDSFGSHFVWYDKLMNHDFELIGGEEIREIKIVPYDKTWSQRYGAEKNKTEDANIMPQALWEMHHSAIGDRGFGVHVDLVLVYDASKLDMVMNLYSFHPTSDGYVFKDQDNKADALLGLIKIKS